MTVTYPDNTTDTIEVSVTVQPAVFDRTDDPSQPTPKGYVRVTFDEGDHGYLTANPNITSLSNPNQNMMKMFMLMGVNDTTPDQLVYDVVAGTDMSDVVPTATGVDGYTWKTGTDAWDPAVPDSITEPNKVYTAQYEAPAAPTDATTYEPSTTDITKKYGETTTEQEIKDAVTVPNYDGDYTVEITDTSKIPSGTEPGEYYVPVTVTYDDNTQDTATVKVTVGPKPDNLTYEPQVATVDKPYGEPTTTTDVTDAVTFPDYPTDKDKPVVTVDDPTKLPDGKTSGPSTVDVTITYPDGTQDHTQVTVNVGEKPDNQKYEPETQVINTGLNTVPDPKQGISNSTDMPEGTTYAWKDNPDTSTTGDHKAIVVVTYPDSTSDEVEVTVHVTADNNLYEPTTTPITKPYGEPTSATDVTDAVTVPNYPDNKDKPKVTVNNPSDLPNGTEPGEYKIPVTVTYPDGTTDPAEVTVTVLDNVIPSPTTDNPPDGYIRVTFAPGDHGTFADGAVTTYDVQIGTKANEVTAPSPKVESGYVQKSGTAAWDPALPTDTYQASDAGTHTAQYDKPVVPTAASSYEPSTTDINKKYGETTSDKEIKDAVSVPGYTGDYTVTITDESKIPNGTVPGEYNVPVTVTYADGSQDTADVKVTVGPKPDNVKYEPTPQIINTGLNTEPSAEQGIGNTKDLPNGTTYTWKDKPDTTTTGEHKAIVVVTYPDNTTDEVEVTVVVSSDADTYQPTTTPIEKKYGETTSESDVTNAVTVPNYPDNKDKPTIAVTDKTKIPDGTKPGEYYVPVSVTYPDGSVDNVTVKVTVGPQPDNQAYDPQPQTINTGVNTEPDPSEGIANKGDLPSGTQYTWEEKPDTTTPSDHPATVVVSYPDGTQDKVDVTVHVSTDAENNDPKPTDITTNPGTTPDPSEGIGNKDDLPEGTQYTWKDDPTTDKTGDVTGTVIVKYPDGSIDEVQVTIHVVDPNAPTVFGVHLPTTGDGLGGVALALEGVVAAMLALLGGAALKLRRAGQCKDR